MASPFTIGTVVKQKTREETPKPGDLYRLTAELEIAGVHRGTMTLEVFVADTKSAQDVLRFIEGETPPASGPRARWDV